TRSAVANCRHFTKRRYHSVGPSSVLVSIDCNDSRVPWRNRLATIISVQVGAGCAAKRFRPSSELAITGAAPSRPQGHTWQLDPQGRRNRVPFRRGETLAPLALLRRQDF